LPFQLPIFRITLLEPVAKSNGGKLKWLAPANMMDARELSLTLLLLYLSTIKTTHKLDTLKSFFLAGGFTDEEVEQIVTNFTFKNYKKGDFFAEEGKTSKYLGFIEKGFFQYFINLNGEEKTTYSIGANNLIASLVSFLKQVPSRENIRAAVPSSTWLIRKDDFNKLQQTIPSFKDYYISILEWQVCCIEESRIDGIMLSAGQRYEKMMFKEPDLIQQIPVQYLASIIGVTPRHLSRIRNNLRLAN
jgi:CRP-like cAMP-binding protein